jgi:hypothetical protein
MTLDEPRQCYSRHQDRMGGLAGNLRRESRGRAPPRDRFRYGRGERHATHG